MQTVYIYIEVSVRVTLQSEVTTCKLSLVLLLFVGGRQLCGNSSRLRYSDPNPRGQSKACFGNNFHVITGTPIVGTLFVAAFHAPEVGTTWQAQAALFTLWPFAQRPPRPDNRFFSLAVPWRLVGTPSLLPSELLVLPAAFSESLVVAEVAP